MIEGRDRELAALEAALGSDRDERRQPVLLVGEAGMGKTALLDALARRARRRGIRVVRVGAAQGVGASPFAVVADIARGLSDVLDLLPPDEAAALHWPPRTSATSGEVPSALLHLLSEAAHLRQLLVLIDDVHWADRGSLDALALAVGRLGCEPVDVVVAARPRPALDPRIRAWARLDVGPLDPEPAVSLLRAALPAGIEPSGNQSRRVVTALGRCPLAIVESTRLLSAGELIGADPLPDPLPLDDRLLVEWGGTWAGLPEPIRTAVLVLCVAEGSGAELVAGVLADLGLSPDDLDPSAAQRLLVRSADSTAEHADLAHPLIRDAVLRAAGPAAVRAMHRRAARCAEQLGLAPSVVIAQLEAGASPGDHEAISELLAQADRALADELGEPAAHALLAAASLTLETRERSHLAARAARVLLDSSLGEVDTERILELVDMNVLAPQERLTVEWLHAERLGHVSLSQHQSAMEVAIAHAVELDSPETAWMLWSAVNTAVAVEDGESAMRHAASLLAWAGRAEGEHSGHFPAWACRAVHAVTLFQVGDVAAADGALRAARQESRSWGPARDVALGELLAALVIDLIMGDLDPRIDVRLQEPARRGLGRETMSFVSAVQAHRALGRAQFADARALIDDSISLERASAFEGVIPFRLATAVLIDAHIGDHVALTREVAEMRNLCRDIGWTQLFATADRAEGLQALGDGRLEVALNKLEPLAEDRLLGCGPWDAVLMGRADLVEALVRSGERDRASEVASALTRILGPSSDPIAQALVSRSLGLVNHGEGADEAFVSAIADFRGAGLPFEEARTRLLRGELLRRERHVHEARRELRTAAASFERMGAVPWARQATDELRATGAAVQPRPADPWANLTPQERRVAEAVAAGGSDRQVAAELFLSHRTVSYHLSSVYRKLGVTNRTALANRFAEWKSAGAGVG